MDDDDLSARLDRIEARQRDHEMHDPECPVRIAYKKQFGSAVFFMVPSVECTCWLSVELVGRT